MTVDPLRRLAIGVSPPMAPLNPRGVFLGSFTSKFADNLEWNACKLITLFVIFFHAIILPDHRFFFEVPPFEELQDPDGSPRREEVGRRTLRDYGGFLLSFLYRDRFQSLTSKISQLYD